jgi:surface polysaccharide O-acyltransferase-like enzyme
MWTSPLSCELQLVTGFVGYFVMGHFLNVTQITRRWRIALYVLGALSVLVAMFGTYALTNHDHGRLDEYFLWSLSLNVIVLSLAVFVASQYARWPNWLTSGAGRSSGVLVKLSGASLGVYLIHPMVLEVLGRLDIDATLVHPLVGIPLTLAAAVTISFVAVLLMQKIPLVRRLVP